MAERNVYLQESSRAPSWIRTRSPRCEIDRNTKRPEPWLRFYNCYSVSFKIGPAPHKPNDSPGPTPALREQLHSLIAPPSEPHNRVTAKAMIVAGKIG